MKDEGECSSRHDALLIKTAAAMMMVIKWVMLGYGCDNGGGHDEGTNDHNGDEKRMGRSTVMATKMMTTVRT